MSILIPRKSSEPYRNVKNLGILLDLEKIFGESKNRLMSKSMKHQSNKSFDKENSNLDSNNHIKEIDSDESFDDEEVMNKNIKLLKKVSGNA